jgi:hypothetical protein
MQHGCSMCTLITCTRVGGRWYRLCHPGGPGCKTNRNFKKVSCPLPNCACVVTYIKGWSKNEFCHSVRKHIVCWHVSGVIASCDNAFAGRLRFREECPGADTTHGPGNATCTWPCNPGIQRLFRGTSQASRSQPYVPNPDLDPSCLTSHIAGTVGRLRLTLELLVVLGVNPAQHTPHA